MAVRRERVILDLETNIPSEALKAAAAVRLLDEEVKKLNRSGSAGAGSRVSKDIEDAGRKAETASKSIDKYSGRLGVLADVAITLGPALVPIGAVGIPALTGLASSFGFAALGAGSAVLAFHGVGDALKALNKAQLDPTTANLQAARLAMEQISPAAQEFTKHLAEMGPQMEALRSTAAAGMFPGLTQGLDAMSTALPKVQRIVAAVSGELGHIGADAGKSLAGPQWAEFFTFLETEAPKALADMATGIGHVAHAAAQLWMAFSPLNHDFSSWLVHATAGLDRWATGLSNTQGFQDFIAYVEKEGPQVGQTLAAVGNALVQIVQAAAPIGGPVLKVLEALANVVAGLANSDLGTPIMAGVIAMRLYARAAAVATSATERGFGAAQKGHILGMRDALVTVTSAQQRAKLSSVELAKAEGERSAAIRKGLGTLGKAAGLTAGLAVASSGLADQIGMTNTVSLGLAGTMGGPWGVAIGLAVGAAMDLSHATDDLATSVTGANAAMRTGNVDAMTAAYTRLVAASKTAYGVDLTKPAPSLPSALGNAAMHPLADVNFLKGLATGDVQRTQKELGSVSSAIDGVAAAATGQTLIRGFGFMGHGFGLTAAAANQAAARLQAAQVAARATGQSFITLGKDVDNTKVSLNGWIHQLAAQAAALRNFTANAQTAANRGLRQGLIAALEKAGPQGALRMKQLADGTQTQIRRANAAWGAGQRAIKSYVAATTGVPKSKTTTVKVNGVGPAKAAIWSVQAELAGLRDKSINITVSKTFANDLAKPVPHADGGTVEGQRHPYGDKVLTMLAPGEEVISNRYGQADAFRAMRAAGEIPHFADGGSVGGRRHPRQHNSGGPGLVGRMKDLEAAVKRSTSAISNETAARDNLVQARDSLSGQVSGAFQSEIFGGSSSVWAPGGGAGNVLGLLKGDIAKANAFKATLANLSKRGVNGQALAAIASTGDVGKAQALAGMSNAQLGQYESLYNQRTAAANAVGSYAGTAAYGAAIARDNAVLVRQETQLKLLNRQIAALQKEIKSHPERAGHAVAKGVNKAATAAQHKKRAHH